MLIQPMKKFSYPLPVVRNSLLALRISSTGVCLPTHFVIGLESFSCSNSSSSGTVHGERTENASPDIIVKQKPCRVLVIFKSQKLTIFIAVLLGRWIIYGPLLVHFCPPPDVRKQEVLGTPHYTHILRNLRILRIRG
jgi:hypothetical protein